MITPTETAALHPSFVFVKRPKPLPANSILAEDFRIAGDVSFKEIVDEDLYRIGTSAIALIFGGEGI